MICSPGGKDLITPLMRLQNLPPGLFTSDQIPAATYRDYTYRSSYLAQ